MNVNEKLTDEQVAILIPGVTIWDYSEIRGWQVQQLLQGAIKKGVFHPLLVTAWDMKKMDHIPSIDLTINMNNGVYLCGQIWTADFYTDGDLRGIAAARNVLQLAENAVRHVVDAYNREVN